MLMARRLIKAQQLAAGNVARVIQRAPDRMLPIAPVFEGPHRKALFEVLLESAPANSPGPPATSLPCASAHPSFSFGAMLQAITTTPANHGPNEDDETGPGGAVPTRVRGVITITMISPLPQPNDDARIAEALECLATRAD